MTCHGLIMYVQMYIFVSFCGLGETCTPLDARFPSSNLADCDGFSMTLKSRELVLQDELKAMGYGLHI